MYLSFFEFQGLCDICYQKYDYILHLENITTESKYLFHKIGYPNGTKMESEHKVGKVIELKENPNSSLIPQKTKILDYNIEYYKNIPKSIIDKLRRIYFVDFLTFGYSIP